jgi:hypothetical protein
MSDFPVLDGNRDMTEGRVVISELGELEPYIDEVDGWVSMPVRVSHTAGAGVVLELGPYSLDARDVARLRAALRNWGIVTSGPTIWRIK